MRGIIVAFTLLANCGTSNKSNSKESLNTQYKDTVLYERIISIPANSEVSYLDHLYEVRFNGVNIDIREGAISLNALNNELSQISIIEDTTTEYKRIYYGHTANLKLYYLVERRLEPYTIMAKGLYGYTSMTCELDDMDVEKNQDRVVQHIFETYLNRTKQTRY